MHRFGEWEKERERMFDEVISNDRSNMTNEIMTKLINKILLLQQQQQQKTNKIKRFSYVCTVVVECAFGFDYVVNLMSLSRLWPFLTKIRSQPQTEEKKYKWLTLKTAVRTFPHIWAAPSQRLASIMLCGLFWCEFNCEFAILAMSLFDKLAHSWWTDVKRLNINGRHLSLFPSLVYKWMKHIWFSHAELVVHTSLVFIEWRSNRNIRFYR